MERSAQKDRPVRVLIATGESWWNQEYWTSCEKLNCEVERVSSGFEALRRLRRERFDVVIGDDSIADLTPFELALYVRDFASNHTAIVLAGLDATALPAKIRGDNKLFLSGSRRESLDCLPDILSSIGPVHDVAQQGCCA